MSDVLEVEVRNNVGWLTLNRPEKRNALSPELLDGLRTQLDAFVDNEKIAVIVLRAAGSCFSAGYDLDGRYAKAERPARPWIDREHLRRMSRTHEAVWDCPLPVIAGVQGPALAGGADLALHCDFIVMATDAYLAYPPAAFLGTAPTNLWVYRAGITQSRAVLLAGGRIDAQTALDCGLAYRVAPVDALDDAVTALAESMAVVDRELLISNKWVINRGVDLMGRSMLQRIAASEDALAHTSAASLEFKRVASEHGLRAALDAARRKAT